MNDPYGVFGRGYVHRRRTDPRIAALIESALGDARTVVNVGAGTGSYEPLGRKVIAVEPSPVMIRQRPPGSAAVVRAFAEHLPLPDQACDAAMAILTIHHWRDPGRGLAELRRVARRQVIVTWDQAVMARFWLIADYLPEIAEAERDLTAFDAIQAELTRQGALLNVMNVDVPADCHDGFLAAYWARPEAYLDPAVHASISSLAKLSPARLEEMTARLADDLAGGRWQERHGALRDAGSLDVGYRLIIAEAG
ncbi:methyltransferase type 11 [Rhizocola hellebori]|uniref:Methyltransferase type 11 n=1 Tax=Rhizocola hellebori TaxID=1392758 RepID=A0A8J3QF76_9ACTN|nr:class I SAM-dependent methyltransferase [Rhizocola hellebori]GIH08528.1 methyltransferase type 11 [Rhizocola hellebori]